MMRNGETIFRGRALTQTRATTFREHSHLVSDLALTVASVSPNSSVRR